MLVTFSPSGFEDVFGRFGEPARGDAPPEDAVMPAPDEFARLLASYGCQRSWALPPPCERTRGHGQRIEPPDIALTELAAWAVAWSRRVRRRSGRGPPLAVAA